MSCHIFNIKLLIETCHMLSAFLLSLCRWLYIEDAIPEIREKREVKLELSNLCSICINMLLQWDLFFGNSVIIIQLLPIYW